MKKRTAYSAAATSKRSVSPTLCTRRRHSPLSALSLISGRMLNGLRHFLHMKINVEVKLLSCVLFKHPVTAAYQASVHGFSRYILEAKHCFLPVFYSINTLISRFLSYIFVSSIYQIKVISHTWSSRPRRPVLYLLKDGFELFFFFF